jgi:hypothetical protein
MKKVVLSELNNPISLDHVANRGSLLEGVFSVKDSKIDSKIFHSWKIADLLPTVPKGGWAELSFIDLLWLDTLETMRKFGCSRNLMKAVCKKLFYDAYEVNLGKLTLEENHAFLTNLAAVRALTFIEKEYLNSTIQVLNDPIYMSVLDRGINYFYHLVTNCFIENNEVGLVIYLDGSFSTYESKNSVNDGSVKVDLSVPHILIPISSFIRKFIDDDKKEEFLNQSGVLNEQEFEVLKLIRKKNIKSLKVTFNNNVVKKIEIEESGLIHESDVESLKQILCLKQYDSIELHSRDARTMSFIKTKKIYMDKM